ncbi:MAG: GIY-YIG nuclease family protein [Verrucomicrobia bacterium]|jgi:putative endonuclease|nr:GIY-YIG nuclease family protein [Verrucomicrobiota bacterium]MDA1067174.1 GIY-YIG nuclease family protein [Verrucomicrobiota bacterium]
MYYVYRIQSINFRDQSYTGFSSDLEKRLAKHNAGGNRSTAPFRPWKLVFYAAFEKKESALDFEKYLKTGSGKAFARKRLWLNNE